MFGKRSSQGSSPAARPAPAAMPATQSVAAPAPAPRAPEPEPVLQVVEEPKAPAQRSEDYFITKSMIFGCDFGIQAGQQYAQQSSDQGHNGQGHQGRQAQR